MKLLHIASFTVPPIVRGVTREVQLIVAAPPGTEACAVPSTVSVKPKSTLNVWSPLLEHLSGVLMSIFVEFSGVLAHAVGSWVLVERLSTPAALQDGKCLGLLPALLGRPQQLRGQQQPITADSPKRKSVALQRQQRRAQLLQQCATVAQAPRISVLRHPVVGHAIAFAIDTTTRLAATISSMNFIIVLLCL